MAPKIIVSFDGTDNDYDALALVRLLRGTGAAIELAYVRHYHERDVADERAEQRDAEEVLEQGAHWLGDADTPKHVVINASTGEGLRELAEHEGAELIVFGSDWHTAPGHTQPLGSTQHLLEGGPIALAVAPVGLRDRLDASLSRIAVVDDGDGSASATARALTDALAGHVVASPEQADLLIVGSRPEAVEGRVSLSAATSRRLDSASSAVLVVPRATPALARTHAVA